MKTLKETLVDHNLALLEGIAEKRGLSPPKNHSREAIRAMADALLSPASVAIALADLSAAERAALTAILTVGGKMNARDFFRTYGDIRTMGTSRLLREKPWLSPPNPAEGLWYRGLIFSGFQHTVNGPEECIFIPADLQAQMPAPQAAALPPFQVDLASQPAVIHQSNAAAREDLFTLLVYLQTRLVRLTSQNSLPPKDRVAVQQQFSCCSTNLPPADQPAEASAWFDFVLHLARRMDFLRKQGQRLKLNSPAVKTWLQKTEWEQLQQLQHTWRTDSTWNDLWQVPSLFPKETGWENSPMRARAKILHYLSRIPLNEWIAISAFVQAVKTTDPNFQRPAGDYQSWYLYNAQGEPLMGFEQWDAVEGALIRHIITATLFTLGLVDLGASYATAPPAVFKITSLGQAFLFPESPAAPPDSAPQPQTIRIHPSDFSIQVPAGAGLYHRFQLARFAGMVNREPKRCLYQITRQSFLGALEQSITLEQILAFLNRATSSHIPLPLVDTLHNWNRRTGSVKLEKILVLRVNHPEILRELTRHPQIGPLLGAPLDDTAVVIPEKNAARLKSLLVKFNFLDT